MSADDICYECQHALDDHGFAGCVVHAEDCDGPTDGDYCACPRSPRYEQSSAQAVTS